MQSRGLLQALFDDDDGDDEVESQVKVVIDEQVIDCNNEAHSQHVHCPPKSKPKGRPKQRRLKDGKELSFDSRFFCASISSDLDIKVGIVNNPCEQWLYQM